MADRVGEMDIREGESVPRSMQQWYIRDRDHMEQWRKDAQEDYEFVAGRQWSDAELEALRKKSRPIVVFNRIGPVVDSVHGQEIGNRREVRYIPREPGDVKSNELLTSAAEWFRDQSHADDQESDAFLDTLICGMGWTETRIDYEMNADGDPVIERVDPLEMCVDFEAKGRNLADARRVWRVRRVPLSEAQAMFPDFSPKELDATWTQVQSDRDLEKTNEVSSGEDMQSGDYRVTLVQVQWIERESYYRALDPFTGQEAEFSTAEFATINKRMKPLGMEMPGVRQRRKVRKQAFLGDKVLAVGDAPCPHGFSLQCITGKRDRNKGTWYGIVRAMKDPQRWANKWLSQMMHIMNSNSKGGLLAERGAFESQAQAEESWSDPSAITWMEDGAISQNKVKDKPPAQFPAGFQQLTEFAISSIRDTTGVSVEMLGMREANQAASLEMQRRQAGMTILQPLFDALKHYREMQGRVLLYYIQNDLSDGRLVKIAGDENEQYVPLVKQATAEYDIIVDDAPTSPNQKEAVWSIIAQLLPSVMRFVPPQMLLKLLEYSPLPSGVVADLKQLWDQQAQQASQQGEMQAQIAMEAHQAEMADKAAGADQKRATAAKDMAEIEESKARMGWEVLQGFQEPRPAEPGNM